MELETLSSEMNLSELFKEVFLNIDSLPESNIKNLKTYLLSDTLHVIKEKREILKSLINRSDEEIKTFIDDFKNDRDQYIRFLIFKKTLDDCHKKD